MKERRRAPKGSEEEVRVVALTHVYCLTVWKVHRIKSIVTKERRANQGVVTL